VSPRSVLADEARDFTPWLASNLRLLADALGLDELEAVAVEHRVDNFRLDIRAIGVDKSGEQLTVVIENQYGRTDHDHLGKLVTYAAQAEADPEHERVLAVWVTEHVQPAHLAAVEFLNRTSVDEIGWVLVQAKFAPAPTGHYVHFEMAAKPNAFLREASRGGTSKESNPDRLAFMAAVSEQLTPALLRAGYRHVWTDPKGWLVRAYLPSNLPIAKWSEVRIRTTRDRTHLLVRAKGVGVSAEENQKVLDLLRARYEALLRQRLPPGTVMDWNAGEQSKTKFVDLDYPGEGGFLTGDPGDVATWATTIAATWLAVMRDDPIIDLPTPIALEMTGADSEQEEEP
jgi:hypothetical protein